MSTGTEGMKPLEPHKKADNELARLRKELAEERIKTEALSRHCIELGKALDAAEKAKDARIENDMFKIVNENCDHRRAVAAAEKHRRAVEKKTAAYLDRACKRNSVFLSVSAVLGLTAALLGFTEYIGPVTACVTGAIFAMAFGWALNDCVYLLGRCNK